MNELLSAIITTLLAANAYFLKKTFDKVTILEHGFRQMVPAIIEMQGKFVELGHKILFPLTITPGSPLKLTEYGDTLLRESGFYKILKVHKEELIDGVKLRYPKTKYDVQEYSTAYIKELLDGSSDLFKPLKDYAYESGMHVEILVPPAGIALRDEVLKKIKI